MEHGQNDMGNGTSTVTNALNMLIEAVISAWKESEECSELQRQLSSAFIAEMRSAVHENTDLICSERAQIECLRTTIKNRDMHIRLLEETIYELQSILRQRFDGNETIVGGTKYSPPSSPGASWEPSDRCWPQQSGYDNDLRDNTQTNGDEFPMQKIALNDDIPSSHTPPQSHARLDETVFALTNIFRSKGEDATG